MSSVWLCIAGAVRIQLHHGACVLKFAGEVALCTLLGCAQCRCTAHAVAPWAHVF